MLIHGVQSMQNLSPAKEFRALIANGESLDALLEIKGRLEDYLPEEGAHDLRARDYLWREVLWKAAPEDLREKYRQVFA